MRLSLHVAPVFRIRLCDFAEFRPDATDAQFEECVKRWLDLRLEPLRLLIAASDQVPPETPFRPIETLAEAVDTYGRY